MKRLLREDGYMVSPQAFTSLLHHPPCTALNFISLQQGSSALILYKPQPFMNTISLHLKAFSHLNSNPWGEPSPGPPRGHPRFFHLRVHPRVVSHSFFSTPIYLAPGRSHPRDRSGPFALQTGRAFIARCACVPVALPRNLPRKRASIFPQGIVDNKRGAHCRL